MNNFMRHYTIEYIDDDGDTVIQHVSMTQPQALELLEKFVKRGTTAKIYDLTPPQVDEASTVILQNDELAKITDGRIK